MFFYLFHKIHTMNKTIATLFIMMASIFAFNFVHADASSVYLTFCEWTQDKFIVDVWEQKDLCFELTNWSEEKYNIKYWFTDAHVDEQNTQICWVNPSTDNYFAKLFKDPSIKSLPIDAWKTETIKERVIIPIGVTWTMYGCLYYTVEGSATQVEWSMVGVQIARYLPIKIFVGKMTDIKNQIQMVDIDSDAYTTNKKVGVSIDEEGSMNLSFLIENQWNVEQDIEITGKVYNAFGFEKAFTTSPIKVAVGEKGEIKANVGIVPFYKWFFSVKFTVKNTPSFIFDASMIDEKYTKSGSISEKSSIFIFSWVSVLILILGIRIIIKLLPFKIFGKKSPQISQIQPQQYQAPLSPQAPQQ